MRTWIALLAAAVLAVVYAPSALAVSGAGYTTVNAAVDGQNHCKNGNPGVNCNIYDAKPHVWLNGGPAANGLGPDGSYFFAVLAPGGQPNPNDGGPKNLSDDYDAYTNRTFTVTNGEVSAYAGTHDKTIPLVRLYPYADTTNPGGVYIMAICSLGAGYPVDPRSCKYDAFKVQRGPAKVQAVLSGRKYFDANANGQLDTGELGLAGWTIQISGTDGTSASILTDAAGYWSYTTAERPPSSGTTTYSVSEVQQAGWTQTGNVVDQSIAMGGATTSLASFSYSVTVPLDAVSAAEGLYFGNLRDNPPVCPQPTFGTDALGRSYLEVVVQDADTGLASIEVTWAINTEVTIPPYVGSTAPITIRGTQIDPNRNFGLEFIATDLAGNSTVCDPVAALVARESGSSDGYVFSGLPAGEHLVTITNGVHGARGVDVIVNGTVFRVRGLADGEVRTIDVAAAMSPGSSNEIVVLLHGPPGSSAGVLISN